MLVRYDNTNNWRSLYWLIAGLLLLGCVHASLFAQSDSAQIVGSVFDSSGAVLAGATVTITNTDTGVSRSATTGSSGEFTFPSVPRGSYTATATSIGFAGES